MMKSRILSLICLVTIFITGSILSEYSHADINSSKAVDIQPILYLLLREESNVQKKSILIVVDEKFNSELSILSSKIKRLSSDIENDLQVVPTIWEIDPSNTAQYEIKEKLKYFYQNQGLIGVIFIGDIPVALTESEYCTSCLDQTYYEDLDSDLWEDPDGNGIFNIFAQTNGNIDQYLTSLVSYKWKNITWIGEHNSEIWSGYLIPPVSVSLENRINMINNYLDNNHNYRTGHQVYTKGLIYLDSVSHNDDESDTEEDYTTIYNQALLKYENSWLWNNENGSALEFIWSDNIEDQMYLWLNTIHNLTYEYAFISVHGGESSHWFGGNNFLYYNSYKDLPPNAFMIELASCSNGNFQNSNYLAGWMLFSGKSLVITANFYPTFYASGHEISSHMRLLGLGLPIGEAITKKSAHSAISVIFGDPTLRLRGKNSKGPITVTSVHGPTESALSFSNNGGQVTIKNDSENAISVFYQIISLTSLNGKFLQMSDSSYQVHFSTLNDGNFHVFNPELLLSPGETRTIDVDFNYNGPFLSGNSAIPGVYKAKLLFYTDTSTTPHFEVNLQKELIK